MFNRKDNSPNEEKVQPNLPKQDPIKHIVLLMMENQSFDRRLGCFKEKYPDLEGIDPNHLFFNLDNKGTRVYQKETREKQMPFDPGHELADVLEQIKDNNSGFVKNFIAHYPQSNQFDREQIMAYYPKGFLPATHALADEFTICDHWHSDFPGSTWPNRFFTCSGTSSGRIETPDKMCDPDVIEFFFQNQKTIFDCLDEANKSWKTYYYDFPISLVFSKQRETDNLKKYHKINYFFKDAAGDESEFPAFSFIEPKYMGQDENDDHPPHNTMKAEKLIADIYNAIRANQKLWESTLFVLTYDEHGGFYDHIQPPATIAPDKHTKKYSFNQLGVRVPTLLISPWVKQGVNHHLYSHSSLLKYMIDKWKLPPLTERTNQANTFDSAFDIENGPRKNCLSGINISHSDLTSDKPEWEKWDYGSNHQAIYSLANFIHKTNGNKEFDLLNSCSTKEKMKEKIGGELIKFGMWLQKDAHSRHISRINNISNTVEFLQKKNPFFDKEKTQRTEENALPTFSPNLSS